MSERTGDFIKGLLIGGLAGAVLGILFAPKSGKETREQIGKKTEEWMNKAKGEYEQALEKGKKVYETAVNRLTPEEYSSRSTSGTTKEAGKSTSK